MVFIPAERMYRLLSAVKYRMYPDPVREDAGIYAVSAETDGAAMSLSPSKKSQDRHTWDKSMLKLQLEAVCKLFCPWRAGVFMNRFFSSFLLSLFLPCILLFTSFSRHACAGEEIAVHGFLSQGYMNSAGNNFLADSKDGTFQINEVGLTIASQVNDQLRLGLQALSRDLGRDGNNEIRLDWGYADYHHADWLGVRLGKIKRPMGLYNEERDSDFLRPMAFLPQSIYDEVRRDMLVAYQGVGLYGNVPVSRLGDLDYQVFRGEFNFPDDSLFTLSLKQTANAIAQQKSLPPVTDLKVTNSYVEGAWFVLNTGFEGLRLGASFLKGRQELFLNGNPLPQGELTVKNRMIYSVEYSVGSLTIASELGETDRRQIILGNTNADGKTLERYVMATYELNKRVSLSAVYDEYYNDKHDRGGNSFASQGKPYLGWRKDLGIGLRYDVNPNWALKAEWHKVDGGALYMTVLNPTGVQRDWNYMILKSSFNF